MGVGGKGGMPFLSQESSILSPGSVMDPSPKVTVFEELSKHNYRFPVELIEQSINEKEK